MTTQQDSSNTTVTASNAERIGKAVAEVAKRIRIQDFEVVSIKGDTWSKRDKVTVSLHAKTHRDLMKVISYFRLDNIRTIGTDDGTMVAGPCTVTGLPNILVEAFGLAVDDTEGGAA